MKKKILAMLLAAVLAVGLLPGTAFAMAVWYQTYTDTNAFGWTFRDDGGVVPATLEFEAVKMIYETVSIDDGNPQYVSLYLVKPGSSVTSADGAETTFSYEGVGANYLGGNKFSLDPWYVEVNWSAKTMTAEEFFAGGEDGDRFDALWVYDRENSFGYIIMLESLYDVTVPSAPEEPTDPEPPAITFDDVDPNEYYAAAVNWAVENQYAVGTDTNIFSPDDTCTHIQILTFLWRTAGRPSAPQAQVTLDPGYHEDYHGAFNWAYEQGMVDADFDPEADCTRADTVKYLWLADDAETGIPDQGFIDLTGDEDYFDAVNWAAANGITKGDDSVDTFNPTGTCTRGQIVTFLHRVHVPEVRDYR